MAKIWDDDNKSEAIQIVLDRICDGESLRGILHWASRDRLPSVSTFLGWVKEDTDLQKQYARACEVRAEQIFDEILEISNESNADLEIGEKGNLIINGEAVQRSRLKIDARKWALSKMNPKKYGDKVDVTTDGEKINSVTIFELPNNGRK